MTQEDPNALARLLGVSVDTEPDKLRAAYELAMHRATRAGDHARALQLSRVFDALPDRMRLSVYSGTRTYPTVLGPHAGRDRRPRRRRTGSPKLRSGRRRRISWKGLLIYGLLIPGIVVLAGWGIYRQYNPSYDDYPQDPPVQQRVAHILVVPADAPADRGGFVSVRCQATADGPTVVLRERPGALVTCPDDAPPRVIAP